MAEDIFEEHEGTHILQSLDGFALSLNSDGRFLYVSETVSIYLGLSQVSSVVYKKKCKYYNNMCILGWDDRQ